MGHESAGGWGAAGRARNFSKAPAFEYLAEYARGNAAMSDRDYYEILGLTPRADGQMVDASYWHLVRKYQALAATNPRAQRLIDELNEAYGVLGNPKLRKQYDAFRDDVLIRSGMIQPVASKPKRSKKTANADDQAPQTKKRRSNKQSTSAASASSGGRISLPSVRIENGRTYAISGIIALLAFAAAWQGVNIVLVAIALAAGLGMALTPTLKRRIGEMTLDMPSMPSVSVPQVKAPKLNLGEIPAIKEISSRDEPAMDADTLRQSTAATISRWRQSVGLRVTAAEPPADDVEELQIAAQETAVEEDSSEPLDAVMHILRHGASRAASR